MLFRDFLNFLLDDALEEARLRNAAYPNRLAFLGTETAVAECRDRMMGDGMCDRLADLLHEAREESRVAVSTGRPDQWFWFAREAEVEWIASVLSVILLQNRLPAIVPPSRGAAIAAARIAGSLAEEES